MLDMFVYGNLEELAYQTSQGYPKITTFGT
jgi:hypothetical protein